MMPVDAKAQTRILYYDFLRRMIDVELLSATGDPNKLLGQGAALLCALGLMLGAMVRPLSLFKPEQAWGIHQFLISLNMAVTGLFAVISWDNIFPNRRDCLVLGMLPVSTKTVLRAKLAALGTGLGVCLLAVNLMVGIGYPLFGGEGFIGRIVFFGAYWLAFAGSGAAMFFTLLALQGLAAELLPYRHFTRASNLLQIVAFFAVLSLFLLTPGPTDLVMSEVGPHHWITWLPAFWFVGLFGRLIGHPHPLFAPLAGRALWSLAGSATVAVGCYALAYGRGMRAMVEQPDIAPGDRSKPSMLWATWIVARLLPKPVERAVFLFVSRTLTRSRQHRLVVAIVLGFGLPVALAFTRAIMYGNSPLYAPLRRYGFVPPRWDAPSAEVMSASFVLLLCFVVGPRLALALPATLKANWIFRVSDVHRPKSYFIAVRRVFATIAIPAWLACSAVVLAIWPTGPALLHVGALGIVAYIATNVVLKGVRKFPFACSYEPGNSRFHVKAVPIASVAFVAINIAGLAELEAIYYASQTVVWAAVFIALAAWTYRRWRADAYDPWATLQFDDTAEPEILTLGLFGDSDRGRYLHYLDAVEPEVHWTIRTWRFCWKAATVAAAVLAIGALYEQIQERRNPIPARVGTLVDLGGRSLNIHCEGQGSPTVIFESGRGGPGMSWNAILKRIAPQTRACWYDRAGYGWSDPAPWFHPATAIAADLHTLLERAGEKPPFVLVGASFGGLLVRVYRSRYPGDVSGMVLVDSTYIDARDPIEPPGGGWLPYHPAFLPALAEAMRYTGLLRMFEENLSKSPFEPRTLAESMKEQDYDSFLEDRSAGPMGDLPLVVLTATRHNTRPPNSPIRLGEQRAFERRWVEAQTQLAALSTNCRHLIMPDTPHDIAEKNPDAVVDAVMETMAAARRWEQAK